MSRLTKILLLLTVAAGLAVPAALARSPHFVSASATNTDGSLTVDFHLAGLGTNVAKVDITLSATVLCVNNGGRHPTATNKGTFSTGGTFDVDKSGNVSGSLTLPPSGQTLNIQPPCDPPMTIEFTNVTLTAFDHNSTTPIAGPTTIPGTF